MILKSLHLKNFLIHEDTKIDFSEKGITVFIGENGAGKSSILEAITFALFGKSDKGNQASLVKWGRKQATVILDFQKGNSVYRIERVITLRGNKASSTGTVYQKKGDRYIPYYQKNITKEIPKLTGITNKIFSSSILVKQGDIEGILKLSPKERGKVLEEILDMTLYQLLSEKAAEKRKTLQIERETLKNSIPDTEEIKERIDVLEKEYKKLLEEKEDIEKRLSWEKQKERELKDILEKVLNEKNAYEKKLEEIQNLKEKKENYLQEINRYKNLLHQIEEKEKQLKKLEEEVKELEKIEELLKTFMEYEKLEEKNSFLEKEIKEYEGKRRYIQEYSSLYETYISFEKEYKTLNQRLKELSIKEGKKETLSQQIKKLKEERKKHQLKALEIAKKLQSFKKIYKTLELNPVIINQFIQNNKEAIDFYTKKKEELLKELSALETEGKKLNKDIQNLEKLEGTCPTCKRPIEEHSKEALLKELREELEAKREKYKKIKEEIQKIEEKLSVEKQLTPVLEEFKQEYEKYKQVNKEINQLEAQLSVLEQETKGKSEIEKKLIEIEEYLTGNKEKYEIFMEAKRFLKEKNLNKIKEEYERIKEKIEYLKNQVKEIKKSELERKLEDLKRKEREYIALKEFVKQKDEALRETNRFEKLLEETEEKIKKYESQIEKKDFDTEIELLKHKIEEKYKSISLLTENLLQLSGEIGKIENEISSLKRELKKAEEIKTKLKQIEEKIKKYEKVENALGVKGIQRVIRENALYRLPKIVNIIFSFFDFPFQQIKFSEDFDISLLVPTIEKEDRYIDINSVSGGQRVALALALRIAISRFLTDRADFLILDEPTVHLDSQRRNDLINILIDLKEKGLVNQLILVTHDTEIEDAADTIYYIENGKIQLVK